LRSYFLLLILSIYNIAYRVFVDTFVKISDMREELFPLVDADGNVIGKATRSHCHDGSMLLHPVVHLHIFNSRGELFLQKRSDKKEIFPGFWDSSVGGHINFGEEPLSAVIRETGEELNLKGLDIKFIRKHIIQTRHEKELTYCYFTVTDKKPQPDMDEVSDGRYWSIDEIKRNFGTGIFTPNFEVDFTSFLSDGMKSLIS